MSQLFWNEIHDHDTDRVYSTAPPPMLHIAQLFKLYEKYTHEA